MKTQGGPGMGDAFNSAIMGMGWESVWRLLPTSLSVPRCIGHVGPEATCSGTNSALQVGDVIEIDLKHERTSVE
jgi:dihydroxyacid dehydratase/phosphogluconate dehydratase